MAPKFALHQLWIALSVAAFVAAGGFLWGELRRESHARERSILGLASRIDGVDSQVAVLGQRFGSQSRVLEDLCAQVWRLADASAERAVALASDSEIVVSEDPLSAAAEPEPTLSEEELQPLPAGVKPTGLMREFQRSRKFADVVNNPALNPTGRLPDPLDRARIMRELTHANARIEIIDADVQLKLAEARASLSEAAEYVDYAPGERYATEPGVLTYAEKNELGYTRMYYMYREEFPELYELRAQRKLVAEEAVRRVAGMLR